jgi:hypothetical protein
MKKTFNLVHPKIKPERLIESYKNEVKKYIQRERRKDLPSGSTAWNFECKYGADQSTAKSVRESEVTKLIGDSFENKLESFYLELIAVPGQKPKPPVKEVKEEKPEAEAVENELEDQ